MQFWSSIVLPVNIYVNVEFELKGIYRKINLVTWS